MEQTDPLIEKYSSAVTLSDMEIFVFPELMYSLMLANIMSPRIWNWLEHDWFRKLNKLKPYRKILRLKQFIIDQYEFNLDLDTWGLTTQEEEIRRFGDFISPDVIAESNALFGYQGDQYYFDIDIRRHFGLDKYEGQMIPYWKTETVEAMDAFRFREGYSKGAGECVSLAALYGAALYVVCGIPLEDIYLMATPLHSQNFVDINGGILTNNRRIVTKSMWFNGTELTAKAQRALRNEQVTIVAHNTGFIHTVYPEATISRERYEHFSETLHDFMTVDIDMNIVVNFLRENNDFQRCFQIVQEWHGHKRYLPLETAYHYEHSGPYKANQETRSQLLDQIDEFEWSPTPYDGRAYLCNLELFFDQHRVEFNDAEACKKLVDEFECRNKRGPEILQKLTEFVHLEPRLPAGKTFVDSPVIHLDPGMSREAVIAKLQQDRAENPVIDLAFYAYRDLGSTDWAPFLKAALERNPVSVQGVENMSDQAVVEHIAAMPNESIYDGKRAAQPDEVWNFERGDGFERALCLANILKNRHPDTALTLQVEPGQVKLDGASCSICLPSSKGYATQRIAM